ncbi:zinc finger protein 234-like, partial [Sabethes cyaneus]|uniref:zinc finger protein 234-like n=1 Tax=Sabethes cyaneus TaxID=53552 RepID=UPI00237ECF4A
METSIKLEESTTIKVEELIITDVSHVKSELIDTNGYSCETTLPTTSGDRTPVVKQASAAKDIIDEVTETAPAAAADKDDTTDGLCNSHALEADPPSGSGSQPKHTCDICGASYKSLSGLHYHKKIHTSTSVDPKPYKCDQCSSRFTQKCGLNFHKKQHLSLFNCVLCSKTFTLNRTLKVHFVTEHMSKRNFKCDICGNESFR